MICVTTFTVSNDTFVSSRKSSSASVGTSLTAGQRYFFDQRSTWFPHTKKPTVGLWGEGIVDDPNIDLYNVKGKNVSAVHHLYSDINRGIALSSKTISKKKNAICSFLATLPTLTLAKLLEFDDEESKYKGFRDINTKQHFENLAIIFSGSYNGGESGINDSQTPYVLSVVDGEYTVTAKDNWQKCFPTVVMLQRNVKVAKSILERFLIGNTRHSKSSSSWTPLNTPTPATSSSSSYSKSSATTNDSYADESFESFMSATENTTGTGKMESLKDVIDDLVVSEYSILNDSSPRFGSAVLRNKDSTETQLEFDMDLTIRQPRQFKGVTGTHKWTAYQEFYILDKIDIKVGDNVVVIGISKKGKIHIADPAYYTFDIKSNAMNTFTVNSDIFAFTCIIQNTPESL